MELEETKGSFTSAANELTIDRLTTGSENIDYLLGGGLELGAITQFYGGPGMGKTHLCHLLCVVLPSSFQVVYVDTERTFSESKIKSIATARGLNWEKIRDNIQLKTPAWTGEQESDIDEVCSSISNSSDSKVKLIIIDSMTFHYKAEYSERSQLAQRASKFNSYMHKLHRLAVTKKIAVVFTNYASANEPDEEFRYSNPKPFGGNILSHASKYIVNFAGKLSGSVMATLTKSPTHGPKSLQILIDDSGFYDASNRYLAEKED